MNEIAVRENAALVDHKAFEEYLVDIYSKALIKDLKQILQSPPKSLQEFQQTINLPYQTGHKANSLVQFLQTFSTIEQTVADQ